MVLATKYKNTNFFYRFIAVLLSIILMSGSAFFTVRIIETCAYTDKAERILKGEELTSDLSGSNEVTENLLGDIFHLTNKVELKDEKEIEKTLLLNKDKAFKTLLNKFKKDKTDFEETIKDLENQRAEYDEDGNVVETTDVDINEVENSFIEEYTFDYKGIELTLYTEQWKGTQNEILLSDSEETANKKLNAIFESFVKDKIYLKNVTGEFTDKNYSPPADLKYYVAIPKKNLVVTNFENDESPDNVLNNKFALVIKNNIPKYSPSFENVLSFSADEKSGKLACTENDIEYYFYVDTNEKVNNGYAESIENYYGVSEYSIKNDIICAVVLLLLSLVAALWYFVNAGTILENGKAKRAFIDYIPSDIHFILTGGIITGLAAIYIPLAQAIDSSITGKSNHTLFVMCAALLAGGIWAFFIEFLSSFIRVCKSEKKIYNNIFVVSVFKFIIIKPTVWLYRKVKRLLTYKPENFKYRFTRFLILYGAVNLILFIICVATKNGVVDILPIAFNVAIISFCVWYAVQLDRIITSAHNRTVPNVDYNKLPQSLKTLYNSLRFTQQELETAVAKAVRDERMRSELITNVSHDLKTPLTSIITYVDLLKTCDIDDDNAKDYINVLDEKSNRLKRLIDDLIEASKITSGVITLNPVNLSLTELAAQAVGERNREFTENGLELVFDGTKNVGCFADGNKTFRIIENLLSNAKKYSLKGSRVYCSVYETQNFSIFEIKNTSAQPLNISPEELTERFVRGDKSRTNEGNGLGLSIADNLCRAQGGHLYITIDGDLFKAQVMLPKTK